jgi:broad specificity phosphatase PhoE
MHPPSEAQILLIRHGPSAHVPSGWIDTAGFRAWRAAYEAAGIRAGERAPADLLSRAASAALIVASDAPRAIASARSLALDRDVVVSPLLRELELPGPELGPLRLPLRAWAVAVGGRLLVDGLRGRYPSEREKARIEHAASWLDELAQQHGTVVAVTHASFRGRVAKRLLGKGWMKRGGGRSLRPWSAWSLGFSPTERPRTP